MDGINAAIRQIAPEDDFLKKHLTFQIAGQYYGIPISHVIEIVQIQPATEIPGQPLYTKGVINLRGQVVPLIDVNLRFGKPEREYTDRTCIIIVDVGGMRTGLIVNAVEEVLEIEGGNISTPPAFSGDDSARYVTGIAKINKTMVLLLNIRLLVSEDEMGMFEQLAQ